MKENKTINTIKKAVGLVSGVGVAAIVGNAVKHVSPTNGVGAMMRLCIGVGTAVLGGIACDASSNYVNKQIDEAAEFAEEVLKDTPEEVVDAEVVRN